MFVQKHYKKSQVYDFKSSTHLHAKYTHKYTDHVRRTMYSHGLHLALAIAAIVESRKLKTIQIEVFVVTLKFQSHRTANLLCVHLQFTRVRADDD